LKILGKVDKLSESSEEDFRGEIMSDSDSSSIESTGRNYDVLKKEYELLKSKLSKMEKQKTMITMKKYHSLMLQQMQQ
jgi:cell fate regulator YaaT (PSP1 superfamily)